MTIPCQYEGCDGTLARTEDDDAVYYTCSTEKVGHEWCQPKKKVRTEASKLELAGIPPMFRGRQFEQNEHNKSALLVCRGYVADFRKNGPLPAPALWGRPGRGKSHLLSGICAQLINKHAADVMYRSARQLLREFQDFDGGADEIWQRAVDVEVLALDDLGAQQHTEWRDNQFSDLVNERYQAEKPILVTSNFKPTEWPKWLGERTASRLREMTLPVELQGPDRRQQTLAPTAEGGTP